MVFYRYADDQPSTPAEAPAAPGLDEVIARATGRSTGGTEVAAAPRLKLAIVTCMDARIDPVAIFGLAPGDAHVIRNAGAWVTDDALRSLSISQVSLGTQGVIVMGHTQCGLQGTTDEEFARALEREARACAPWGAGAFEDLDAHVRAGVERVRTSGVVPHREAVRGLVYDVANGTVRAVT